MLFGAKEMDEQRRHVRALDARQIQSLQSQAQKGDKKPSDKFLTWLFCDIARRPPRLSVRCAPALRYLKLLSALGISSELRNATGSRIVEARHAEGEVVHRQQRATDDLANTLWLYVINTAPIKPTDKRAARRFLRDTATAIFPGDPRIRDALAFLETHELPVPTGLDIFRPPAFISRGYQKGRQQTHLLDDVTERIYVAGCVLKRMGESHVSIMITDALNAARIQTRDKGKWDYVMVNDRVKSYRNKLRAELSGHTRPSTRTVDKLIETQDDRLVHLWLLRYLERGPIRSRMPGAFTR